jgi:hypothetical protein
MHAEFHSSQAAELRAFLRDKLGFAGADFVVGWLIFDAPGPTWFTQPTPAARPPARPTSPSTATTTPKRPATSPPAASNSLRKSPITATAWSPISAARAVSKFSSISQDRSSDGVKT